RADLSARQLTVLLTIYLESPPHTVRGLAAKLRVTKPVITRALDSMGKLGLVSRKRDVADRRNVIIQRTVKGALYVEELGDLLVAKAQGLPGCRRLLPASRRCGLISPPSTLKAR